MGTQHESLVKYIQFTGEMHTLQKSLLPLRFHSRRADHLYRLCKNRLSNTAYESIDVQMLDPSEWSKIKKTSGKTTVPQIFISGNFLGGNTELQTYTKDQFEKVVTDSKKNAKAFEIQVQEAPKSENISMECEFDEDTQIIERLKKTDLLKTNKTGWFSKVKNSISKKKLLTW